MVTYLDNAATTRMDPDVREKMLYFMDIEFGNSGSRTHKFGSTAKRAVSTARDQIAQCLQCDQDEIIFTSGATESNNIALLGLLKYANETGRKHIVSTAQEHRAILEPLEALEKFGLEIELVEPNQAGLVTAESISAAVRADTVLVSIMHVNNETGVEQPIEEISDRLKNHEAFLHVDAAQGFGKKNASLQNKRIDMASISGHKINAPVGIGALMTRRRKFKKLPLSPLFFGGGQQGGLRPGTLPAALIAALGQAAENWDRDAISRLSRMRRLKSTALEALSDLNPRVIGDNERAIPGILNVAFPGVDAEAAMVVLKDLIAVSNGSACTSSKHTNSHVLQAMGLPSNVIEGAIRISWSHASEEADWASVGKRLQQISQTSI